MAEMFKYTGYMICKRPKNRFAKTSTRYTATPPTVLKDEIAVKVSIEIPESLFVRPQLHATISLKDVPPKDLITTEVARNIEDIIKDSLGITIKIAGL